MDIIALCPLSVGGFAWQPSQGFHAFVIIAKATYNLGQGTAQLADIQDGLVHGDSYWDDDTRRSVYAPSDMVPYKERADVTLVGDAHAPISGGARRLTTRLHTGNVDKRVSVVCDRFVDARGRIRLGLPFQRMTLRYERASFGASNPVGVHDGATTDSGVRPLPNLEAVGRQDDDALACYAPLASRWPARQQLLGGAHLDLDARRWREQPIPSVLHPTFFNDAPEDQRLDELKADQTLVLEHLHPHLPRMSCQLPGVRPRAFVEGSGIGREIALTADTLWIDMTRNLCTVTWRGSFEIARPDEVGRVLVALEQPGQRLIWPDVVEMERTGCQSAPSHPSSLPAPSSSHGLGPDSAPTLADSVPPPAVARRRSVLPPPPPARGSVAPPPPPARGSVLPPPPPARGSVAPPAPPAARTPYESAAPLSDSQVRRHQAPAYEMEEMSMAVGADQGVTQAIRHRIKSEPLPFKNPEQPVALAPGAATPTPLPPPKSPPPPRPNPNKSPWARGISRARHALTPPPSPPQPAIAPPPLMLVPSPAAPPSQPETAPVSSDATIDPLANGERIELLGNESDELERVRSHFNHDLEESSDDLLARGLRQAFGAPQSIAPSEARRAVVRIMTRNAASSPRAMKAAMDEAIDEDGLMHPPLTLAHGMLSLSFDEVETLKATMACVAPYLKNNEALSEEVEMARELLDRGLADSPDVAVELTDGIEKAYQADEAIDSDKVRTRIERMLLSRRAYQIRALLGGRFIRAQISQPETAPLPCYIPEAFADDIPLFAEFMARAIGELHAQQDQYESNAMALRVIALGRVISAQEGN